MIEPARRDQAFLRDLEHAQRELQGSDGFALWWLGQSGFLLSWRDRLLLLDPYLSDTLTRKYAGTSRPHVRMTSIVVDPSLLPPIDVVAVTHAHTDHLDPETLGAIIARRPEVRLVVPEAIRTLAAERSGLARGDITGVDHRMWIAACGFAIAGVAAAHETIELDEQGHCVYLSFVVRFGRWTIFHAGDTIGYDGLAQDIRTLAPHGIDVALLPINGRDPSRETAGNLNGTEAARLARDLASTVAVPCHYEMFEFNSAPPSEFVAVAARTGVRAWVLRGGQRLVAIANPSSEAPGDRRAAIYRLS